MDKIIEENARSFKSKAMKARDNAEKARRLKAQAIDAKDEAFDATIEKGFKRAVTLIREAENLLKVELQRLRQGRDSTAEPSKDEVEVAAQLSHILGSKGGIYRRWGKFEESAKAYDEGYQHERWVTARGTENSYNLVQRLVSRVLINPSAVSSDAEVLNLPLRQSLQEAKEEVGRQIKETREKDMYAHADLAMTSLLLGSDGWESTLKDGFIHSKPPPSPYAFEVTIEVVDKLKSVLSGKPDTPPDLADRIASASATLEPYRPEKEPTIG